MSKPFRIAIGLLILVIALVAAYILIWGRPTRMDTVNDWLTVATVRPLGREDLYDIGIPGKLTLATDGRGHWISIAGHYPGTTEDRDGEKDLYIYRSDDNGDTWTAGELLHREMAGDERSDLNPQLATDRNGNWVVVWSGVFQHAMHGGPPSYTYLTYFSASRNNGETWSEPTRLNPDYDDVAQDEEEYPLIATDGDGVWMCAVLSKDFKLDRYSGRPLVHHDLCAFTSTDAGETWSSPKTVFRTSVENKVSLYNLALASGGTGCFTIGWTEGLYLPNNEVAHRTLTLVTQDGGNKWGEPLVLNRGYSMDLILSSGPERVRIAAWLSTRYVDGNLMRGQLLSARSINLGQTWAPDEPLGPLKTDDVADYNPRLATNGNGSWLAVWMVYGYLGRDNDIFASVSLDDGRSWCKAAPLNPGADSDDLVERDPVAATDGQGRWIVAWTSGNARGYHPMVLVCDER